MKNDNRLGDKVKDTFAYDKGTIIRINKSLNNPYVVEFDYVTVKLNKNDFVNLSAIGRKAALASSKKVGRDSKGRFTKKDYEQKIFTVGDKFMIDAINPVEFIAFGGGGGAGKPTLESLEKRIEALEKKQPEYKNCGGVNGCNGTC